MHASRSSGEVGDRELPGNSLTEVLAFLVIIGSWSYIFVSHSSRWMHHRHGDAHRASWSRVELRQRTCPTRHRKQWHQ